LSSSSLCIAREGYTQSHAAVRDAPSLSTSGETLTIEESMTLGARTENAGDGDEHEWSWSGVG
jgi:hypothetical protein